MPRPPGAPRLSPGLPPCRPATRGTLAALKPTLDALATDFERASDVADPVRVLTRYPDVRDREVVAFFAAGLAFGRVQSVLSSVEAVLRVLGPQPAEFVRRFHPARDGEGLRPLVHRWTRGDDLVALVVVLRHMLEQSGSLERFFAEGLGPLDPDVSGALESFSSRACQADVPAAGGTPGTHGVAYFFSRPSAGSACKRLNLFLRWMVRCDAIDPGGWTQVRPAQLIVPLDVHVIRVGQCLGLTRHKSPGWAMAAEITSALRSIDPVDPVRYDFALCHLGMLGQCRHERPASDAACPLAGFCRPSRRS